MAGMARALWIEANKARRDAIIEAVRTGATYASVGQRFGISGARVCQIAAMYGIKRKVGRKAGGDVADA